MERTHVRCYELKIPRGFGWTNFFGGWDCFSGFSAKSVSIGVHPWLKNFPLLPARHKI
jgi:hypothetical protein